MKCDKDIVTASGKKELGEFGEKVTGEYYEKEGFEIIARNFRSNAGEIDIIAKKGDKLIFIEVKSRINFENIKPYEAVDKNKRLKIISTAKYYLKKNSYTTSNFYIRFDIANIFVKKYPSEYTIEIFKNVFDEKGKLI